jgi:c(7)-type cytochrome triheme protein
MRVVLIAFAAMLLTATAAAARIGGGELTFEVPKEGNVIFSHESHVASAGLTCTQCHDAFFVTKERHSKASMKEMRKGKSCGGCHDGKRAFAVKENCKDCHAKEVR